MVLADAFARGSRLHVYQRQADTPDIGGYNARAGRWLFGRSGIRQLAQVRPILMRASWAAPALALDEFRAVHGAGCSLVQVDGPDRGPRRAGRTEPRISCPSG